MAHTKTVYSGNIIDVSVDQVTLPNGESTELEVIHHPGGAGVVAMNDKGEVCLLKQYRYVAGEDIWELPAGKLEPGEEPLITAKRELQEEAGLCAAQWVYLGDILTSPGVLREVIHLFLATDLTVTNVSRGRDEVITVHWIPLSEALLWAQSGRIKDAKTLVALAWASK